METYSNITWLDSKINFSNIQLSLIQKHGPLKCTHWINQNITLSFTEWKNILPAQGFTLRNYISPTTLGPFISKSREKHKKFLMFAKFAPQMK